MTEGWCQEERCVEVMGFMMLNVEGRRCQSPAGCLMKMTLGLYCRPKRELLSPKSFRAETLGAKLPDFNCGFMPSEGFAVLSEIFFDILFH